MNTRFDPSSCCTLTAPTFTACCDRYTGSVDDAPPLAAIVADWIERGFTFAYRIAREALQTTGRLRQ